MATTRSLDRSACGREDPAIDFDTNITDELSFQPQMSHYGWARFALLTRQLLVAILQTRRLHRHVSLRDIILDRSAVAKSRIAPAAAAGASEDEAAPTPPRPACRLAAPLFPAAA